MWVGRGRPPPSESLPVSIASSEGQRVPCNCPTKGWTGLCFLACSFERFPDPGPGPSAGHCGSQGSPSGSCLPGGLEGRPSPALGCSGRGPVEPRPGSSAGRGGPLWALGPAGWAAAGAGPLAGKRNGASLTSVSCCHWFVFPDPVTCLGDGKTGELDPSPPSGDSCAWGSQQGGPPGSDGPGLPGRRGLQARSGAEPLACLRVQTSPQGASLHMGKPRL